MALAGIGDLSQIFPKWANKTGLYLITSTVFLAAATIGFFWYYGSPEFTDVGYQPNQPVPYSHKLHAGDMGIDCRYCHYDIEYSAVANIPATQICMNCHRIVMTQSEILLPIRESWEKKTPVKWIRVHQDPDYVYFNHAPHLRAGVGCGDCHDDISAMEAVRQTRPLSMSWCLDCHRDPDMHLRPEGEITNMNWTPPADQLQFAARVRAEKGIQPPVDCSGCHR
jgi:hypothetical protein